MAVTPEEKSEARGVFDIRSAREEPARVMRIDPVLGLLVRTAAEKFGESADREMAVFEVPVDMTGKVTATALLEVEPLWGLLQTRDEVDRQTFPGVLLPPAPTASVVRDPDPAGYPRPKTVQEVEPELGSFVDPTEESVGTESVEVKPDIVPT